ncbi:MAG: hypothetical protein AB7P37_23050 [Ramlibacter sp.]
MVPKRLAATLRAAYAQLSAARAYVAHAEAQIIDAMMHLQVFDADPELFAQLYYPSVRDGVASYPVQTNVRRTRELLEHKQRRLPAYFHEMEQAELLVQEKEGLARASLGLLRRDTPGRVPWPTEPASLAWYRKSSLEVHRINRKKFQRYVQQRFAQNQRRKEDAKREDELLQLEMDALIATMPPAKAMVLRAFNGAMRDAQARGQFGMREMLAVAAGDRTALKPILDRVQQSLGLN